MCAGGTAGGGRGGREVLGAPHPEQARGRDEHREVLLAVAHDHHVARPNQTAERLLDGRGRDVLAARRDDELLDAPGDVQQTVDATQIDKGAIIRQVLNHTV